MSGREVRRRRRRRLLDRRGAYYCAARDRSWATPWSWKWVAVLDVTVRNGLRRVDDEAWELLRVTRRSEDAAPAHRPKPDLLVLPERIAA